MNPIHGLYALYQRKLAPPLAEGGVEPGLVNINLDEIVVLLNEEEDDRSKHHPGSIYMVPSVYRDLKPAGCFNPRVVSIGPLHHKDEHLKEFEGKKTTYMQTLLCNLSTPLNLTPEQILKNCVTKVSHSIDKIKKCYIGMQAYSVSNSKLIKMMVKDACFILCFTYCHSFVARHNSQLQKDIDSLLGQYVLLKSDIFHDMVLIENQIPFFVLKDIFECTFRQLHPTDPTPAHPTDPTPAFWSVANFIVYNQQNWSLADFITEIQNRCKLFKGDLIINSSNMSSTDHDHILGIIHKSYQHPDTNSPAPKEMVQIPSVIELYRSGVRFGKKLDAKSPMEMKLEFSKPLFFPESWSKPTLKMPALNLQDNTESIIRNLIIYEQSSQVQTCVTSYMKALDVLIDTPEDVAKLARSQVLVNYLGSNEEAANTINDILKHVTIRDFCYQDQWEKMSEYYNAYWPNRIAELRHKYFNQPWSIIALMAGMVLFYLTVVQTISTVVQTVYSVKDPA